MGMFKKLSSSIHDRTDDRTTSKVIVINKVKNSPNPNPNNFKILSSWTGNGYVLLHVYYPDCTNYEGSKLLLYKDSLVSLEELRKLNILDPHFYDGKYSPVARFKPDGEGFRLAFLILYPR